MSVDRDLRHSFLEETPYYVGTGSRATFTQRLFRNIDGQVTIGFDRIAYEARLDEPEILGDQVDRVRLLGGGIGDPPRRRDTRLGDQLRPHRDGLRRSPSREYSRGRLYATLNYGF